MGRDEEKDKQVEEQKPKGNGMVKNRKEHQEDITHGNKDATHM